MTSRPPPIPEEQRALHDDSRADERGIPDAKGDADLNLEQQGRHGNLHQNVETVHARTQDR
jgi:hypothetical protein